MTELSKQAKELWEQMLKKSKEEEAGMWKHLSDGEITILAPEDQDFTRLLDYLLKEDLNGVTLLNDVVREMHIHEVFHYILEDDCDFRKHYLEKRGKALENAYDDLLRYCKQSIENPTYETDIMEEPFELKCIADDEMRKVLESTLIAATGYNYFDRLDGKDVIIADNSLSENGIYSMTKAIRNGHNPRSISVLAFNPKETELSIPSEYPERIERIFRLISKLYGIYDECGVDTMTPYMKQKLAECRALIEPYNDDRANSCKRRCDWLLKEIPTLEK